MNDPERSVTLEWIWRHHESQLVRNPIWASQSLTIKCQWYQNRTLASAEVPSEKYAAASRDETEVSFLEETKFVR